MKRSRVGKLGTPVTLYIPDELRGRLEACYDKLRAPGEESIGVSEAVRRCLVLGIQALEKLPVKE